MCQRRATRWLIGVILSLAAPFVGFSETGPVTAGDPPLLTPTAPAESPTLFQAELDAEPVIPPPALADDAPIDDASNTRIEMGFADTEVIEGYPGANCPHLQGPEIHVGYDGPEGALDPYGQIIRNLFKFSVAGIPAEATVHRATLKLYATGSSYGYQESLPVTAHRVTALWAGKTTTWNNQPPFEEALDTQLIAFGEAGQGWHTFDVTSLVAGWVDGSYANNGIVLRGPEDRYGWRAFATSKTIYPPQLEIEYSASPDFELTVVPDTYNLWAGESVTLDLYVNGIAGFFGEVSLAVSGLPQHISYSLGDSVLPATAHTRLTLTTSPETPRGTYVCTVTGVGGSQVHSAQVRLTLRDPSSANELYLPLAFKSYAVSSVAFRHRPAVFAPGLARDATPLAAPSSLAILSIGISDYKHMLPASVGQRAGIPGNDLDGAASDALNTFSAIRTQGNCCVLATSLVSQCFCPVDKILVDAQATKAAIHSSIVSQDGSTEVFVLTFSGHGMYAPDDDGDEADGYDEFLVPYEIENGASGWDHSMAIRDDELARWLDALTPPPPQIVILIDSCFSGGIISSAESPTRGLDWQPNARPQMTSQAWIDGMVQDLAGNGRVILAASAENQPNTEFVELEGGAFTYFLLEAFRTPSADENGNGWISAEEAYRYLDDRVDAYVYASSGEHQNPQIGDGIAGEVDLVQVGDEIGSCPFN